MEAALRDLTKLQAMGLVASVAGKAARRRSFRGSVCNPEGLSGWAASTLLWAELAVGFGLDVCGAGAACRSCASRENPWRALSATSSPLESRRPAVSPTWLSARRRLCN